MSTYPEQPGYRADGTSKEAAQAAAFWAGSLRFRVLVALLIQPMTAEECAARLQAPYESVHPRISELKALGLVHSEGTRRVNSTGKTALVWRVVRSALPAEFTGLGQGELFR